MRKFSLKVGQYQKLRWEESWEWKYYKPNQLTRKYVNMNFYCLLQADHLEAYMPEIMNFGGFREQIEHIKANYRDTNVEFQSSLKSVVDYFSNLKTLEISSSCLSASLFESIETPTLQLNLKHLKNLKLKGSELLSINILSMIPQETQLDSLDLDLTGDSDKADYLFFYGLHHDMVIESSEDLSSFMNRQTNLKRLMLASAPNKNVTIYLNPEFKLEELIIYDTSSNMSNKEIQKLLTSCLDTCKTLKIYFGEYESSSWNDVFSALVNFENLESLTFDISSDTLTELMKQRDFHMKSKLKHLAWKSFEPVGNFDVESFELFASLHTDSLETLGLNFEVPSSENRLWNFINEQLNIKTLVFKTLNRSDGILDLLQSHSLEKIITSAENFVKPDFANWQNIHMRNPNLRVIEVFDENRHLRSDSYSKAMRLESSFDSKFCIEM